MNAFFVIALFVVGLLTAVGMWMINLKAEKLGALGRWGTLLGVIVTIAMFVYSLYCIKDVNYNFLAVFGLSIGMALVWLLACGLAVGLFIIVGVGVYWIVTTLRQNSFRDMWRKLKADFASDIMHLKNWLEGEE